MIRLTKNESKGLREMKQENERQKQEMKEQAASLNARIDQLINMLKQRIT